MFADGIGTLSAKLAGLPDRIAEDCHQEGQVLRCGTCGSTKVLDAEAWATYLANGWPACHGQTMRLEGPS